MNKKLIAIVMLGAISSQFVPYIAFADTTTTTITNNNVNSNVDWAKQFPDLTIPDKKDMKPVTFSQATMLELDEILKILDELETNFQIQRLDEVFQRIFDLHTNMPVEDSLLHSEFDQFDYIIYRATYLAFTKLNEQDRENYFIKIADQMYMSALKRHNNKIEGSFMRDYGTYYGGVISKYFKSQKTKQTLWNLNSMLIAMSNISFIPPEEFKDDYDYKFPEDQLPSNIKGDNSQNDDIEYLPPTVGIDPPSDDEHFEVIPDDDGLIFPNNNSNDESFSNNKTTEYVAKGKSCFKITTTYDKSGNVINSDEQKLSSAHNSLCNIFDYEVIDGDTWNSNMIKQNNEMANNVWDSLAQNDLNKLSNYTIYFTTNKDDDNPYYYDSGIRVSEDLSVSYTQLRDVLIQLSLKVNGYLIEDKDKFLFISEGKPLVVKDKKEAYSKDEVQSLLSSFSQIDLKIDEIDKYKGDSLAEQAVKGQLKDITIDDKKVTLSQNPILEGSILKLPISEIAKHLGLSVSQDDKKLSISNSSTKFEYEIGTKNVYINRTKKILSSSSVNKDGVVFGEMSLFLKEFGYNLKFDSFSGKIEITNNK